MREWLVTGYAKTGTYAEVVSADSIKEALKLGKQLLAPLRLKHIFITRYTVRTY